VSFSVKVEKVEVIINSKVTMAKYKVLEAFELNGVQQEVGVEIELTPEQAAEFGSKVEAVPAPAAGE
jgi:hypothetical protein